MKQYDYLIVGSGLFGAVFAHMATKAGKSCLVIDKRPQLGGNIYCENCHGINVHQYGAHIFHTSNKQVWDFVNSLVPFNRYTNCPVAEFEGKRYNRYHTIYLDTPDEEMYTMHHNGRLVRQKVRVRTYMDSGDTFLEVKNKNNHGRTKKKRMTVGSIHSLREDGGDTLLAKHANYLLDDLVPKVENRFERITLVNMAKTERLTIDCHVKFHHFETDIHDTYDRLVIIELKRDGNVYSPVKEMLRELRIKPSGFSKYCIGSALTNPKLKRNRFKPRFKKIDKLLNKY